jgi:hypothetical protein
MQSGNKTVREFGTLPQKQSDETYFVILPGDTFCDASLGQPEFNTLLVNSF